jgi:hypothetical protein
VLFRIFFISFGLILICLLLDKNTLKFSMLFSLPFSLIINLFFYFFELISISFFSYETYYGLLSPIFLLILEIHIIIHIIYLYFLFSNTYTKISKIKVIKG